MALAIVWSKRADRKIDKIIDKAPKKKLLTNYYVS